MIELTCPHCHTPTETPNALCDECYSEYLGTHLGGRGDDNCDCNICQSVSARHELMRKKNAAKTQNH